MMVAQSAGVGGGSLAYSSVHLEAHPALFGQGWPAEVTYAELKPYYDTVAKVLNLQTLPDGQLTRTPEARARRGDDTRARASILEGAACRLVLA